MHRGYVKLWRKSIDAGWLRNHELWVLWTYFLMKATHKQCSVIIEGRQVHLQPGQLVVGRNKITREINLSDSIYRNRLNLLKKMGNVTIKPTNKFSIITIAKWADYQSEPIETTSRTTSNRPTTDHIQEHKECKEEKKPLSELLQKYAGDDRTLINQTLQAIAATRKHGKIADSVKASILERFEKYDDHQQVIAGCRTYLAKECHQQGKNEKYLFGIIHNTTAPTGPTVSGFDRALEKFYRNQQTAQRAAQ